MTDTSTDSFGMSSREVWTLAAAYVVGPIALVAAAVLVARLFALDEDVAFFFAIGLALAVLTAVRPWWFWDHPKAGFLRGVIGDRATIVVYLLIALGVIALGGRRATLLAQAQQLCQTRYTAAVDSHSRVAVNAWVPKSGIPGLSRFNKPVTCGDLASHPRSRQ